MAEDYLERILTADVYRSARETRLERAPLLSDRLGNRVLFKREDEQPTFSFKCRGAFNKMVRLSDADRACGVIAASAGNHAQGVALAGQKLGIDVMIVMPMTTPSIKVDAVRRLSAVVELVGDNYGEAEARARELEETDGRVFVHPYDDSDVIAGQGTIGMELLRQHPGPIDAIFVPVGGGGLIAGIGAYVKRLRPSTRVIGVEPVDAAAMKAALTAGEVVTLEHVGGFADGVAVSRVGDESFRVCRDVVDEMIVVNTDEICAAIKDIFEDTRAIMEPAGAVAVAGMKAFVERQGASNQCLVAITSGANMNFDRLRHVAERAELGEQRETILAVTIPERPGSLKTFCSLIGKRNITEFNYRYADKDAARVFVGVGVGGHGEIAGLIKTLKAEGLDAVDLSDNEVAKLHVRHMVGGHAPDGDRVSEVIYRFEFPERPGALMAFLEKMSRDWNISLFHYRNHGTDYGRVLIGLQVPSGDQEKLRAFLDGLGYSFVDESANPAFTLFLS